MGIGVCEVGTGIFSNACGSYSSSVDLEVENSSWNDENQLQVMYVSRKVFSFDSDPPGIGIKENKQAFEMILSIPFSRAMTILSHKLRLLPSA